MEKTGGNSSTAGYTLLLCTFDETYIYNKKSHLKSLLSAHHCISKKCKTGSSCVYNRLTDEYNREIICHILLQSYVACHSLQKYKLIEATANNMVGMEEYGVYK